MQHNIYMLVGAGGNTTVQVGSEGVLMVDTQFAPLAPKLMAEIRKLSPGPLRYIINTHMHPDHVGGNAAIAKLAGSDPALPLKIIAQENVLNRLTAPAPGSRVFPRRGCRSTSTERLPRTCTSTAKPSSSITSRTPTPMATAWFCFVARTSSAPAIFSLPTDIPSSTSNTAAACREKSWR